MSIEEILESREGRGSAALLRGLVDPASVLEAVRDPTAGGNVMFIGTARSATDGVPTQALQYEAYESLAVAKLDELRRQAIGRFGLIACAVAHRLGTVPAGEVAVAVATSSPHRAAAFAAAEWLMAAIKHDVPIWKGDGRGDGGVQWHHPESSGRPGGGA